MITESGTVRSIGKPPEVPAPRFDYPLRTMDIFVDAPYIAGDGSSLVYKVKWKYVYDDGHD